MTHLVVAYGMILRVRAFAGIEACRTLQDLHDVASRTMRDRVRGVPATPYVPDETEYNTAKPLARIVCITYEHGQKESVAHTSRNILFERVAATASPCFFRNPGQYSVALMLLIQRAWLVATYGRDVPQDWWRSPGRGYVEAFLGSEPFVLEPQRLVRLEVRNIPVFFETH